MTGQDLYADVLKVESHMDEAITDMREYLKLEEPKKREVAEEMEGWMRV